MPRASTPGWPTTSRLGASATVLAGTGVVTAVACGWGHTCVARVDGSVSCWGYNGQMQLSVPVALRL